MSSFLSSLPQEHPSGLENLVVPTSGNGDDGDSSTPLDGGGHGDHLAHPASADNGDVSLPVVSAPVYLQQSSR